MHISSGHTQKHKCQLPTLPTYTTGAPVFLFGDSLGGTTVLSLVLGQGPRPLGGAVRGVVLGSPIIQVGN